MKTYSKASTAKTQATKLSAKTGDCFYIEQIGDEFAVMTGAEFLLFQMEKQKAAKKVVATTSEQPEEGVVVLFPLVKDTPMWLGVLVSGVAKWLSKKYIRGYLIAEADDGFPPLVSITLTSEYAKKRKDLLAKAA